MVIDRRQLLLSALASTWILALQDRAARAKDGDDGGDDSDDSDGSDDHGGDDSGGNDNGDDNGGGDDDNGGDSSGNSGRDEKDRDDDNRHSEQDRVRDAVRSGKAVPLAKLKAHVAKTYPGKVISISLQRSLFRYVYRVKILDSKNRLKLIRLDALSLRKL